MQRIAAKNALCAFPHLAASRPALPNRLTAIVRPVSVKGKRAEPRQKAETGLILERTTAQELSQKAGWRQLTVGNGREILQELAQPIGFGMLLYILRHQIEQRLSLLAYHGQLVNHGRIEHGVCIFLIREYPFVLSSSHAWPATEGFLRRDTSVFVVSDDAAQQSVVSRRNVIVVV